jgi:hypothetical protein
MSEKKDEEAILEGLVEHNVNLLMELMMLLC